MDKPRFRWLQTCACIFFIAATSVANAQSHDGLIGIYSIYSPELKRSVDILKLEKINSNYILSMKFGRADEQWPESGDVAKTISTKKLAESFAAPELMGKDLDFGSSALGLEAGKHIILKLAKGWRSGIYKTDTGYLWISPMGALQVSKRNSASVASDRRTH